MDILFNQKQGTILDQYIGKPGETVIDVANKTIRIHNGITPGGFKTSLTDQQIYQLTRNAENINGLVNPNLNNEQLLSQIGIHYDTEKGFWHNTDLMLPNPFEGERLWTHSNWPNDQYLYQVRPGSNSNHTPEMYDYPGVTPITSASAIYSSSYSIGKAFNRVRTSVANGYLSATAGSASSIRHITYNTNQNHLHIDAVYVQGLRLSSDGWAMTGFRIEAYDMDANTWVTLTTYSSGTNTHVNPGRLYKLTEAQRARRFRAFRIAAFNGHCGVARFDLLVNLPE